MSSSDERQRLKQEQDRQRAEIAFWDFYHLGPQRSLSALFRKYVEEGRAGEIKPPSRNKSTLERWRKQYRWDERCAEEDQKQIQSTRRDFEALRRNRMEDLIDLSVKAIKVLNEIFDNEEVPWREKRQAVDTVLDRIGLTAKRAQASEETREAALTPPGADAPQDAWASYYEMLKQQ